MELIYVGRRVLSKGALGHCYVRATDPDDRDSSAGVLIFMKPLAKLTYIGGSVNVDEERPGTFTVRTHSWERHEAVTDELLARWRMDDSAARTESAAAAQRKKMHAEQGDLGDLTLRELEARMSRMLPDARRALLANVLDYLR